MKRNKLFFICLLFAAINTNAELIDKYIKHIDEAEKTFWYAVCGAAKNEHVAARSSYKRVQNELYYARETAIMIEKRLSKKYKMTGGEKLEHITQKLRFLFEELQDHPVNNYVISIQRTSLQAYVNPPISKRAGQNQYTWTVRGGSAITTRSVNIDAYRDWLDGIKRFYMEHPYAIFTGPVTNNRYSKKRSKELEKVFKAVNEYLDTITRIRVLSVEMRQTHRSFDANTTAFSGQSGRRVQKTVSSPLLTPLYSSDEN
jgi:hypothetical protein